MAPPPILSKAEVDDALDALPGWASADGKLRKTFVRRDFVDAFSFMTRVAILAERANHHPDWSNSYKTVTIELVTHESGGITERDVALARAIETNA